MALALRLVTFRDSLLGDELYMFNIVHGRGLGQALHLVRATEKTPPLLFILDWFSSRLGDPTLWVRLPSLICGTALVPITYALGRRLFGRAAGLTAATLVALSAFAIFYGVEDRAYAAVACFSAVSSLCLLKAIDGNRRVWWVGYVLAVLATIYTHYVGFFVVLVQAAWAFWAHRERLRALLIAHTAIVLAYLPWLPSFVIQQRGGADEGRRLALLEGPPNLHRFGMINAQELFGHPFTSLHAIPGVIPVTMAIAATVVAAVLAIVRAWRGRTSISPRSPMLLCLLLAAAAPAGVALVSARPGMNFMLARNLSSSFAMAMLVLAAVAVSRRRAVAIPVTAVLVGVMALGALKAVEPANRRSQFRAAAHYVQASAPVGTPVIQQFFLPITSGALAQATAVNLGPARPVATTPAQIAGAWRRGRRGAGVFLLVDFPGVLKSLHSLPERNGPGNAFVRVGERRYVGLEELIVAHYRYAAR